MTYMRVDQFTDDMGRLSPVPAKLDVIRRLGRTSSAALLAKDLPPIKYVVPGLIAEGLTLLAGKAKIGKSWLILGTAIAVATGGYALGSIKVEQGDVLYLALEDNERRLQSRLKQLLPLGEAPECLFIDTKCSRLDQGLLDDLRAWIGSVSKPRLIIVDVLNRVRPAQKPNEGIYDYDVRSLEGLQGLAAEFGVAIIVVHHTRKAEAEDPFDQLSGSTGLPGTADTTLVLSRDSQGVTLEGRGRDIEEFKKALSLEKTTGQWSILGEADEVQRSDERKAILKVLAEAGCPMSPADIAAGTGMKNDNVRRLLFKMASTGQIERAGYGRYGLVPPGHTGHTGHNPYRAARDGEDDG